MKKSNIKKVVTSSYNYDKTSLAEIIIHDSEKIIDNIDFKKLRNKSILITGATGLLGNYFLSTLFLLHKSKTIKVDINLVIHSDLPTYLKKIARSLKCRVYKGDLTEDKFCKTLPKVDYIIHAAGYGQPGRFMDNPIKTIKINTSSTIELIKNLKLSGSFLFISTSEVYSGLSRPPFKESEIGITNTDHPRACYIEGKRLGETICNEYRKMGINVKSARLSLAYGPGTKKYDKRVLNNFIEKALISGKIEMLDKGEAKRTYCYVTDAVELLWNILLSGKESIYNVGGVSRITIAELAKLIASLTNVKVTFPIKPAKLSGAPKDVYSDLSKIKTEFKKKKFINITDGLKRTVNWQKKLYNSV